MRKWNRLLSALIVVFLLCNAFWVPGFALSEDSDVVVCLQLDNAMMEVNGIQTEIDAGRGTKPAVVNGRTLVPIRAIIEAFGGVVLWDGASQTVWLLMNGDEIRLVLYDTKAYFNNKPYTLDVAPTVIAERTMLPIRFVAEQFNIGVAWDGKTQKITLIKNGFDDLEYNRLMENLPKYVGKAYTVVNNNVPYFKSYEVVSGSFEYYSRLDSLGRPDVCMASVATDIMPQEERGDIGSVTPTGWVNARYDSVPGGYVYNRCHLLGYQLTGENANERNLITGTRYLNIEGMLPFENQIDDYVEETGNHVMYRVTPVFSGDNLVADGVLLEALSVEDGGRGVSFCVYCYNVQPTIEIDYKTGASRFSGEVPVVAEGIYRTPTGKRYHIDAACGGINSYEISMQAALDAGLTPCQKCAQ